MIGEIYQWSAGRNSGRIRPVGADEHTGMYVHGSAFGNKAPPIGTRVSFNEWQSRTGETYATNVRPATVEDEEVERCLG